MKKFHKEGKVNFVDENNVFVGYDMDSCCCEFFGYHIGFDIDQKLPDWQNDEDVPVIDSEVDLDGYVFDKTFCIHRDFFDEDNDNYSEEYGGIVVFKLVGDNDNNDKKTKYLHIFNYHNGSYAHGFDFMNGDKVIKSGSL